MITTSPAIPYPGPTISLRTPAPRRPVTAATSRDNLRNVPNDRLCLWAMRLFVICNLAWEYMDTVCDICIAHRLDNKSLVRQLRALKREYDIFRQDSINDQQYSLETERAEYFSEMFAKDFNRLFNDIVACADRAGLHGPQRDLFIATQQALPINAVVRTYGRWCDKQLQRYGVWANECVMVQNEFLAAMRLFPRFADPHWPRFNNRRHVSGIANRLHIFGRIAH